MLMFFCIVEMGLMAIITLMMRRLVERLAHLRMGHAMLTKVQMYLKRVVRSSNHKSRVCNVMTELSLRCVVTRDVGWTGWMWRFGEITSYFQFLSSSSFRVTSHNPDNGGDGNDNIRLRDLTGHVRKTLLWFVQLNIINHCASARLILWEHVAYDQGVVLMTFQGNHENTYWWRGGMGNVAAAVCTTGEK